MTGQTVSGRVGRRWKVSGRWNDMRIRFPYKRMGKGDSRSCVDFIKGGLDSHNGRCERGHHVAIRAADIAFFRSTIKRHRNNLVKLLYRGREKFYSSPFRILNRKWLEVVRQIDRNFDCDCLNSIFHRDTQK